MLALTIRVSGVPKLGALALAILLLSPWSTEAQVERDPLATGSDLLVYTFHED